MWGASYCGRERGGELGEDINTRTVLVLYME